MNAGDAGRSRGSAVDPSGMGPLHPHAPRHPRAPRVHSSAPEDFSPRPRLPGLMAPEQIGPSAAAQKVAAPKFRPIDAAMILLALVSVTLVCIDIFARGWLYDKGIFREVIIVDAVITLVFLVDFVLEARGKAPLRILKESWFDILGLVPMIAFVALEAKFGGISFSDAFNENVRLGGGAAASGSLLRLFRLLRIVRIVQAFSRFLRATNMTFGEQVTKRFFDKYRRIIVAELTTPIMVAGITVTQEIVIRMKFLESVGKAVDAQRPQIHAAVLEALQKNKVPNNVLAQPFVDKLVNDIENAVVNTLVETLTGDELNALTQKMIVEVMENFKTQLQSPEGKAMLKQMGTAPAPTTGALASSPAAAKDAALDGPSAFYRVSPLE